MSNLVVLFNIYIKLQIMSIIQQLKSTYLYPLNFMRSSSHKALLIEPHSTTLQNHFDTQQTNPKKRMIETFHCKKNIKKQFSKDPKDYRVKLPQVQQKIINSCLTQKFHGKEKKYIKNSLQSLDHYFFAEDEAKIIKINKENKLKAINEVEECKNKIVQRDLKYKSQKEVKKNGGENIGILKKQCSNEENSTRHTIIEKPKFKSTDVKVDKQKNSSLYKLQISNKQKLQRCMKKSLFLNYQYMLQKISLTNGVLFNQLQTRKLTVFVGKGNNHKLVQQTFKRRFYMQLTKNPKEAHIIWNQKQLNQHFSKKNNFQTKQLNFQELMKEEIVNKELFYHHEIYENLLMKMNIFSSQDLKQVQDFFYNGKKIQLIQVLDNIALQNHLPGHHELSDKKNLYLNLKAYCKEKSIIMNDIIPQTFLINGKTDQIINFLKNNPQKTMWILKPAENSNRGNGIQITTTQEELMNTIWTYNTVANPPLIVQEYIIDCLLYNKRKFDIRTYMLVTNTGGKIRAYWYNDGYVRLSSFKFDQKSNNTYVHLTNDAIQVKSDMYGKYEEGNKISLNALQRYIKMTYPQNSFTVEEILQRMKKITQLALESALQKMTENSSYNFQIFGLDFMLDQNFNLYLIQINTNPCLQTGCGVLQRIIPSMLEQSFRIAIDPLFIKHSNGCQSGKHFQKGKFSVII